MKVFGEDLGSRQFSQSAYIAERKQRIRQIHRPKGRFLFMIYQNLSELIGKTPTARLLRLEEKYDLKSKLFAKLEYLNPTGSAKDRAALGMINAAEKSGIIKAGATIIEPTSGNTGIAIAAIAASLGYHAIIIMPNTMSRERVLFIKGYGAEVILTDGKEGMQGAVNYALELHAKTENSFIPSQFDNFENKNAHFDTTGPELYEDLSGNIDIFVAAVGTGGTLSGVGEYLKRKNKNIKVIAAEPSASPLLSGGKAGAHKIQGIGANFIPKVLNTEIYDEVIGVDDDEAFEYARDMARCEGIGVGISSGAALAAAVKCAKKEPGKNIAVILPDGIDRYLSTKLVDFED